jgi:hypothetical protein
MPLSWGMTQRKQRQRTLWEGIVDEDVRALWEPWMVEADRVLEDEGLIERVYDAQSQRHEHCQTRGRSQTPAEMVLRLLLLKHVRNWSYDTLEREVRMNLAYRDFGRIASKSELSSRIPPLVAWIVAVQDSTPQGPSRSGQGSAPTPGGTRLRSGAPAGIHHRRLEALSNARMSLKG